MSKPFYLHTTMIAAMMLMTGGAAHAGLSFVVTDTATRTEAFNIAGFTTLPTGSAVSLGHLDYIGPGSQTVKGSYNGGAFGSRAAFVQDHENGYNGKLSGKDAIGAGLGVYHKKDDTSDDNITDKEAIWLHFDQNVSLSSVGFRAEGHNTTSWIANATFQYSFDNSTWTTGLLPKDVGQFALSHTGHDFYFRFGGGSKADQFYISSMTVSAVPEPETYAMLLIGLGLVSFSLRNNKG